MKIENEKEMLDFGAKIGRELQPKTAIFELVGDVGTGKTTFTRGLAKGLGIDEAVTSPSFTISKAYALPQGGQLVHYDFYRLGDPGLMTENLAENLADPNNIIVIEWGESIREILPKNHKTIEFTINDDGSRQIKIYENTGEADK